MTFFSCLFAGIGVTFALLGLILCDCEAAPSISSGTYDVSDVRVNEITMRGTHASYRLTPDDPVSGKLYVCQRPLNRQAQVQL